MLIPCEVAIKCVLPVVRSMLAKELMTKHGLNQIEVAQILGVSQPAISLYSRDIRGKAIDVERDREVSALVGKMADALATGHMSHADFIPSFCEICRTIRAKGLMCELHKRFDPSINIQKCGICSRQLARYV